MSLAHAMWVHGHSVSIEHPDRLASVWRGGFHVRIIGRAGHNTWLHYAVPTPVVVGDKRLRAGPVWIRFRSTPSDAWIAAVHVYDGEAGIASHEGLLEARSEWADRRFDVPGTPEVRWGLGLSLNVAFHSNTAVSDLSWRIDISSVGCDFLL